MAEASVILDDENGGYYINGKFFPFATKIPETTSAAEARYLAILVPIPDNVIVLPSSPESGQNLGNSDHLADS